MAETVKPDPKWEGVFGTVEPDERGQCIRLSITRHGQRLGQTIIVDPSHGIHGFRYALDRMVREMDKALHA